MIKQNYKKFLEGHANALREKCSVPPFGRLDPFDLAKKMEMRVLMLDNNCGVPADVCEQLLVKDSGAWSGGTLHLPNGNILVVMNPNHEIQRQRATLMEEIAHIHLKHRPSKISSFNGVVMRSWKKSTEDQAYWVGAAALLPERILKGARTLGKTIEQVAKEHGVSIQLV